MPGINLLSDTPPEGGVDLLAPAPSGVNLLEGKVPDRGGTFSPEQAAAHENATYAGAITTGLTGGFRQGVAGGMEAAGDILAPEDVSFTDAFKKSQQAGPDLVTALTSVANTVRTKATRALAPEGGAVREFGQNLRGAGAEAGDQARLDVQAATPEGLGMLGQAGISAAQSVGQMAPWLLAARAGLRPGFVQAGALFQFGGQQFGQTYNEAKAKGAAPEDALTAAMLSGGAEAAGEMAGFSTLLKAGSGWFKRFVAQEIGGEEFTTIAQSLVEKGKYNPEKWSSSDEIVHDLALTALSSAMGAGAMGGINKAANALQQRRAEQTFENSSARRELDEIFTRNNLDPESTGAQTSGLLITPLTPEESVRATMVKDQMKNGLDVEPTTEGKAFGVEIDRLIGENQASGRTVPGELVLADEGGVSAGVIAGREARYQPNLLPPSQRPIRFSSDEGVIGLTLEQAGELPQGSIVAIGGTENDFPTPVYAKVTQDLSTWVKKYMPEARIVLNLEQFAPEYRDTAFGLHQMSLTKGGMLHVITPRDLPGFKYQGGDYKTSVAMLSAVTHEFGHALKMQSLYQGIGEKAGWDIAGRLNEEVKTGGVSPEMLSALAVSSPEAANMLSTWQDLRNSVLDGKMTAKDFVDKWAGLRKIGADNYKTQMSNKSLYTWAKNRMDKAGKSLEGATAKELILAPFKDKESAEAWDFLNEYVSLDEYMAEQFSRAAYTSGDLAKSQTGTLFANALGKLRLLFRDLKSWKGKSGEKIVAPGTTFQSWLDAQTLRAKEAAPREGTFKLSPKIRKAQKARLAKLQAEENAPPEAQAPPEKESPPEQVPVPEEVVATQALTRERILEVAQNLLDQGAFYGGRMGEDAVFRSIKGMAERGQYQQAREKIEGILGTVVNWDREYASKVLERLPNKAKVKIETLKATLKMQDIRQREAAMWEAFAQLHPEGFSLEDARAAVAEAVMPLTPVATDKYADYGLAQVGFLDQPAESIVWRGPMEFGEGNHFKDPAYVMHSRRVEVGPRRYITELQSDLFQHLDEGQKLEDSQRIEDLYTDLGALEGELENVNDFLTDVGKGELLTKEDVHAVAEVQLGFRESRNLWPSLEGNAEAQLAFLKARKQQYEVKVAEIKAQIVREKTVSKNTTGKLLEMKKTWWGRLIREEVTAAFEDGKPEVLFPSADTLAKIEGWEVVSVLPEYAGKPYTDVDNIQWVLTGRVTLDSSGVTAGFEVLGAFPGGVTNLLVQPDDTQQTDEIMEKAQSAQQKDYGSMQGIYNRYKRDVAKFLTKEYGAEKVEHRGHTWFSVKPEVQGSKVYAWDRDNPVQPQHPGIRLAEFAGVEHASRNDEALSLWERIGTNSPYFKNWFGGSKITTGTGVPRLVWRGLGNKVTASQEGKALWFSENLNVAQWYSPANEKSLEDRRAQPSVQGFYLKLENPLVKEADGRPYGDEAWTDWTAEARAGGYDGLVVKGGLEPLPGTAYAIFDPAQAAMDSSVEKLPYVDTLFWDKDSPEAAGVYGAAQTMSRFWKKPALWGMNFVHSLVDNIIQLQQVAASQPDDTALQSFIQLNGIAMKMKNNLQVEAEELVKKMRYASPKTVKDLHRALRAEHAQGEFQATLVGEDAQGNVVWGGDQGVGQEQKANVYAWRAVDSTRLRAFLQKQGIDVTTPGGLKVLEMFLDTRNAILRQFRGLELALLHKAQTMYESAPTVLRQEQWKIDQLMAKYRDSPFLPQGNFGNYVIVTLKDMGKQGRGIRRFQPIRKEHFESQADWQIAYEEKKRATANEPGLKIVQHVIEENSGIPLQLPHDFLEALGNTGMFTDEQIDLMAEAMIKTKFERIEARYDKISTKVEGSNDDFMRVMADFSLRNSNFIWKLFYRTSFRGTIGIAKAEMRALEKREDLAPEEQRKLMDRQRRNVGLMERSLEQLLYPAQEYQTAKLWVTMGFLAGNIKTAAMNAGTQMHTWAAVTSEYGEVRGAKIWAQSLQDAASLPWLGARIARAEGAELRRLQALRAVYSQAIEDGVLDQSYAYYLAGQANSSIGLRALHNSWTGRVGHVAMEGGMFPFKAVEKANRVVSLFTFYSAERAASASHANAYETAVAKTNLLQGDYGAANKPRLLTGKKSIFFMFASYSQMMGWIMGGGYERGARAYAREQGRTVPGAWHGTTMKLWLLYLMLGGIGGLPMAENLLDLAQFVWRKLFGNPQNLDLELRKLLGDVTGDANLAMHGLMFRAGGFDLSGSFGLGRLLPGTDLLNRDWKKPEDLLGSSLLKFAGPAGGFYSATAKALASFASGDWTEGLKQMPGEVGALAKAYDATLLQERKPTFGVTLKDGTRMTWDKETGKYRDLTTGELLGMAMGAQTTLVSENRDDHYAVLGEKIYWQTRRGDLVDKYWKAVNSGDQEHRAEVLQGVQKFNSVIPVPQLRVTGKDLAEAVKSRRKLIRETENFGAAGKQGRGLAQGIREDLGH